MKGSHGTDRLSGSKRIELATFVPDYRTYTYAQQYDLYTICCKDEYWTDSAIDGAMKRRRGVSIISSAACKALYNNGGTSAITQRVDFLLHGSTHVFIVFHLNWLTKQNTARYASCCI